MEIPPSPRSIGSACTDRDSSGLTGTMDQTPSTVRLLATDQAPRGLAIVAGVMWLALGVGVFLFPTPGGEDPLLVGIIGGMAALATVAAAGWMLRRWMEARRLRARGVAVSGRVLRVEANAEEVWAVVVGYVVEGRGYELRRVTGSTPPYEVADTVSLLVDPARPTRAMMCEEAPERPRLPNAAPAVAEKASEYRKAR